MQIDNHENENDKSLGASSAKVMAPSPKREEFLRRQWLRYPAMPSPAESWACSRWADFLLNVTAATPKSTLRLHSLKGLLPPAEAFEILHPQDLVAYNAHLNELILLAPFRIESAVTFLTSREQLQQKWSTLKEWALFQQKVREFFREKDFVEMFTPTLVKCPGTEPYLDVFETKFKMGRAEEVLAMTTSPELQLKKLLAAGAQRIFEFKTCFRNGEVTDHHEPEFTMLEWYRAWSTLEPIKSDVIALFKAVGCEAPIAVKSMADLFADFLQVKITPEMDLEDWRRLAQETGVETMASDSIDEVFHRVFLEKIETRLNPEIIHIVTDYPPFQAAYARLNEQGWADRFEVYFQGFEIANAFHEVNDPEVQRQRMQEDLIKKAQTGRPPVALDEEFFKALNAGMPPSGGIALGLERLFMSIHKIKKIQDLKTFSYGGFL